MPPKLEKPIKLFTAEEANATLPLVRAIAADWVSLAKDLTERHQRLSTISAGRERAPGDPYAEELEQSEREIEKDMDRLREYIAELRELGVDPKQPGLVDFPAMMDGRIVYLCWQYNEPEVLHWHELNDGFAGRQPLTVEAGAGDDCGACEGRDEL